MNRCCLPALGVLLLAGCGLLNPASPEYGLVPLAPFRYAVQEDGQPLFEFEVLKWPQGRRAAVSITYDAPFGTHPDHHLATDAVLDRGLKMDIEMVTAIFQQPKHRPLLKVIQDQLVPQGIHFFGHGHEHVNHDSLTYDEALASFQRCYELMVEWGLRPRAYAYPGTAGRLARTQQANQLAGFLCARGMALDPAEFYICPDSTTAPVNWFYLPSVVMARWASTSYINNHLELRPILAEALERRAWVILMYHAVGIPEGWGYYALVDFEKDLDFLAANDFWSGNMDMAALYIKERNAFAPRLDRIERQKGRSDFYLVMADGLDNALYDQPLTLEFRLGPQLRAQALQIDPPLEGQHEFPLQEGVGRLEILPDERTYLLSLR
ncbi:MAG: hypothetical protein FJY95_18400 [Candidatus Handelsmanbacteria bacterium]|nr:hypothetical protein [Candidatus Handelsmanbacteria bacterium]